VPAYATPGVCYEAVDAGPPPIVALRTDVAGFVGLAERGPLNVPVRVTSWEQFAAAFGAFVPYGHLAYAIKAFFENGGAACHVVRVAAPDAAPAGAWAIASALRIEASSPGSWGGALTVRLRATSVTATSSQGPATPGRTASAVAGVAGFRPRTLARIVSTAGECFRLVIDVDAAERVLHWDQPLPAGAAWDAALSIESRELSLTVLAGGRVAEQHARLSVVPGHDRYIADALDASRYVRARDFRGDVPAHVHGLTLAGLPLQTLPLAGGRDGLAALSVDDLTGGYDDPPRGLRALEPVAEVAMVAIPDIHVAPAPVAPPAEPVPPEPPDPCSLCPPDPEATVEAASPPSGVTESVPIFSLADVFTVQQAMVEHCERLRYRVALLDPPRAVAARPTADTAGVEGWRRRFDTSYATLSFPWVQVEDPLRSGGELLRALPPSGHVAGTYAATDRELGVHHAPANRPLAWIQDVTVAVGPELRGLLNPLGINCLRAFPVRGLRVYGARTLASDAQWRYVNVRRLALMVEAAIERAVQWTVFEPADDELRRALALAIRGFLDALWRDGALVGATPREAYSVTCDPPDDGTLVAHVGIAPVRPAEFVVFRVTRTEGGLEVAE
jgi:Bacteriophage tail sheath protein